tara:strand:+ start:402 stop:2069 length:1668 start_codon:yes stop_codon:yes gene_type:complete
MIKQLSVSSFAQKGINTDLQPWTLPLDFLTNLRNVVISSEQISNYRGFTELANLPADFIPSLILNVNAFVAGYWIIAGKSSNVESVYVFTGGTSTTFTDITRIVPLALTSEQGWNGCLLGNIPIINNVNIYPEYWSTQDVSTKMSVLRWSPGPTANSPEITWEDKGYHARIVRSHKQYLFAMDISSSFFNYPDAVRWSTPADNGAIPDSWDELDITNTAGLVYLGGSGGNIVDAKSLRDAFVVYRETSITVFDYKGGPFVFQIRDANASFGLLNMNCLVEVNSKHYFIARTGLYSYDGNQVVSLLHNRLLTRFNNDFNSEFFVNAFVVQYDYSNEIWFCIPTVDSDLASEGANVAYVYNWKDDTWTIIDLPNGVVRFGALGTFANLGVTWNEIGTPSPGPSWNQSNESWDSEFPNPVESSLYGLQTSAYDDQATTGRLVLMNTKSNFTSLSNPSFIERASFVIDSLTKVTTITRLYPHIIGFSPVQIRVGSQDFPGSPIRWKPPQLFDPTKQRKLDVRTTGELHSLRIEDYNSAENAGSWTMAGINIEYVEAGLR